MDYSNPHGLLLPSWITVGPWIAATPLDYSNTLDCSNPLDNSNPLDYNNPLDYSNLGAVSGNPSELMPSNLARFWGISSVRYLDTLPKILGALATQFPSAGDRVAQKQEFCNQ